MNFIQLVLILQLSGSLRLSDIQKYSVLDGAGEVCFVMGKRGPVSGLTWGFPSELKSTLRYCLPHGTPFVTQQWVITGSIQGKNKAFSDKGDSGAVGFIYC